MRITLFLLATVIIYSSCASIVSHSSSMVGIDTSPQGASVQIFNRNGVRVYDGITPATLSLKHGNGFFKRAIYTVKLTLDGYKKKEVTIESGVNGWYWGNLLFGGVIGFLIVDPATGAMYRLKTTQVEEKLSPKGANDHTETTLRIVNLKDVPEDQRKDLVKLP